jgi:hypothetical protein
MTGSSTFPPPFAHVVRRGNGQTFDGQPEWSGPDGTRWEWTGTALRVRTPRFGFCPLYYCQSGDELALSPSLVCLVRLGVPLELDYDALAVFIRLGFFIGTQTPFKAIRQAAPRQRVEWPGDRLQCAFPVDHPARSAMSRSAALDRYGETFRAAMRKLMPAGDIVLPLSGGRDSRHILFEIIEAGRKPLAVTMTRWAPDIDDDMRIARALAERFGLRHETLGATLAKTRAQRQASELTDFASDELGWMLPIRALIARHDAVAFDGLAGDVLSNGLYLHLGLLAAMEAGNTAEAAELLLGLEDLWERILDASLYKSLSRERAAAALRQELGKHLGAPNPVSSYLFWNRTRREMSLFGFKMLGDVRMPYIDEDVYDHLAALPASYFVDKTFHTETIHRLFPQHADIPFDTKGSSRSGRWRFRAESLGAVAHLIRSRSRWFRSARPLLDLRTKPADVGRMLCLLQLEDFLRREPTQRRTAR